MSKIVRPHDKFFKQIMNDKEIAIDFLKNYLPENLLKLVNLNKIKISKDSFIEKELMETFSDVLYEIELKQKPAFIYLLFEHKSYTDTKITLQLLKYMVKIWELNFSQNSKTDKLPIIIPIVFYHGKLGWNIGLKLSDILQDIPTEILKYVPDFEYILYDLSKFDDNEIKGRVELIFILEVLKYMLRPDLFDKLKEIIALSEKLQKSSSGLDYFEAFVNYLMNARDDFTFEKLEQINKDVSLERSENIMTLAERLEKRGRQKGLQEGIEGMLDIKFGQIGLKLMNKIKRISNIEKLEDIKNLLRKTDKIEDVNNLLLN